VPIRKRRSNHMPRQLRGHGSAEAVREAA
jgi:hypothetical protein